MNLNRLRSFLPIGTVLLIQVVLCNCVLHLLAGTPVLGWLPNVVAASGYLEDNRQRVREAVREYQQELVSPDAYLCAIIGISNVREGIDLKALATNANVSCRYLGLGGAGLGMRDVVAHAQVLLDSDLRPDLVILGISPHQLVDTRPKQSVFTEGLMDFLRRGDLRNAAIAIRNWFWFYDRRQDISISVEGALLDARAAMIRYLKVKLFTSDESRRSPWREMIKAIWAEHFSEATLKEEAEFFRDAGAYNVENYQRAVQAPAALIRCIESFRAREAVVVIVLMPENSRLRQAIPTDALKPLQTILSESFKDAMPPMLDYRDAIENSGFVDLSHMNVTGRDKFSRLLAGEISHFFPGHAPLLSKE